MIDRGDLINCGFELFGALLILNHCRTVLRDKAVAGVSVGSVSFSVLWQIWGMLYYPPLHQWLSMGGCMVLFAANLTWIGLLVRYRHESQ